MHVQPISTGLVDVPPEYDRVGNKMTDDLLRKSIKAAGVEQPLLVVPQEFRFTLVKGSRRLRIARELGLSKVPCVVVKSAPLGTDEVAYRDRLRFIVDEFRQDLTPSQKAEVISTLKSMFGMTHKEVAEYIGIVSDSVRNWLSVKNYIPEVVEALDRGELTMQAARAFDGLNEKGQRALWKAHSDELKQSGAGQLHKTLRAKYGPDTKPDWYANPDRTKERLSRGSKSRKSTARPLKDAEKKKLLSSFEMKEAELRDSRARLEQYEAEIAAAIVPITAIMRDKKLAGMIPKPMHSELERFAEVYC